MQTANDDNGLSDPLRVAYLVARFVHHTLSEGEHDELDDWVNAGPQNMELFEELTHPGQIQEVQDWFRNTTQNKEAKLGLWKRISRSRSRVIIRPVTYGWLVAASLTGALLVFCWLTGSLRSKQPVTANLKKTDSAEAMPSPVYAATPARPYLLLANGDTVSLSGTDTGLLVLDAEGAVRQQGTELDYQHRQSIESGGIGNSLWLPAWEQAAGTRINTGIDARANDEIVTRTANTTRATAASRDKSAANTTTTAAAVATAANTTGATTIKATNATAAKIVNTAITRTANSASQNTANTINTNPAGTTAASVGAANINTIGNNGMNVLTATACNTLITPAGSQFRLTLGDGTRVWLNASSSLRYPVRFSGSERTVVLEGEAYFEVAHQAGRPFRVQAGGTVVQVIGTHFNIDAYGDEGVIKTTLLQGRVEISCAKGAKIISPGQQARSNGSGIEVKLIDAEDEIAWINGVFAFRNTPASTLLAQLSRWYGVAIGGTKQPKGHFNATLPRTTPLAHLLDLLNATGSLHLARRGNQLTIQP